MPTFPPSTSVVPAPLFLSQPQAGVVAQRAAVAPAPTPAAAGVVDAPGQRGASVVPAPRSLAAVASTPHVSAVPPPGDQSWS